VDAREQLRRYLEQRREMGESELVLDGMTVEEALSIVAGKRSGRGAQVPLEARREVSDLVSDTSSDTTETRRDDQRVGGMIRKETEPGAAPGNDWRETLRAAGAAPPITNQPAPPREVESSPAPRADATPRNPSPPNREIASDDAPAGLSVGTPAGELFGGVCSSLESLEAVAAMVASCTRCPLYSTATNPVPGEGNPNAELMLVGEAPGATEDETGRPFVGAAGQLLTKIVAAIDLRREDVFICNVLKHRPPGNRNPRPEEVTACSPYLVRQIELIRPKVIIALGTFAAQTLLDTKLSIGKLRGQIHRYYGVPLVVTYHPAALLRNPSWKRPTWDDVKLARRILDNAPSA
jgi:DNA polymerase